MTEPATSCITCGTLFAPNHELASIPDGSRIAFDPAHRRVWRICTRCETWNLLGADAASAALPELQARMQSASPDAEDTYGYAKLVSSVELLRVGATPASAATAGYAQHLRITVDKRAKQYRGEIAGAVVIGVIVTGFVAWLRHSTFAHAASILFPAFGVGVGTRLWLGIRDRKRARVVLAVATVAIVVGALAWIGVSTPLKWVDIAVVLGGVALIAAMFQIQQRIPRIQLKLKAGPALRMSRRQINRATISWTPGSDDLMVDTLPETVVARGRDAIMLCNKLLTTDGGNGDNRLAPRSKVVADQAYDLLRVAGGLSGVLRALEGFKRQSDGRVVLSVLPPVYLVALELTLAAPAPDAGYALSLQAADAARIAAESEALDLPTSP